MNLVEGQTEFRHDLLDGATGRHQREEIKIQVALRGAGHLPAGHGSLRRYHLLTPRT